MALPPSSTTPQTALRNDEHNTVEQPALEAVLTPQEGIELSNRPPQAAVEDTSSPPAHENETQQTVSLPSVGPSRSAALAPRGMNENHQLPARVSDDTTTTDPQASKVKPLPFYKKRIRRIAIAALILVAIIVIAVPVGVIHSSASTKMEVLPGTAISSIHKGNGSKYELNVIYQGTDNYIYTSQQNGAGDWKWPVKIVEASRWSPLASAFTQINKQDESAVRKSHETPQA